MVSHFDVHCTMFSADSALALLCTCEDSGIQDALRNRPEAIAKLRTALDPLPANARSSGGNLHFAQPRMPQAFVGFGGQPVFVMAPGPQPSTAQASSSTNAASAESSTASPTPQIPVRGRGVPHSKGGAQQSQRSASPQGAWHMDRAGHTRRGSENASRSNHSKTRRGALTPIGGILPGGISGTTAEHRHSTAAPAGARRRLRNMCRTATLRQTGGQILYTPHARPHYLNKGKRLCAIACTNTPCPYGQHSCNQTLQGDESRHAAHQCSWCKRDRDAARR